MLPFPQTPEIAGRPKPIHLVDEPQQPIGANVMINANATESPPIVLYKAGNVAANIAVTVTNATMFFSFGGIMV